MSNKQFQSKQIDQNDLATFRIIAIIFLLAKIGSIVLNYILPILGSLVNYVGTLALAFGIIMLARKYPPLSSGLRVGILFVISVAISLLSTLDSFLSPSQTTTTSTTASQAFYALYQSISSRIIFIVVISFVSAIVILLTAYYFTIWFNDAFGEFKPTKTFLYYGIFTALSSIIVAVSEYFLVHAVQSNNITANSTNQELAPLFPFLLLMYFGLFLGVVGAIVLIVACIKIYFRVNDKFLGKTPFNQQKPTYNQPYAPDPEQDNQEK